MFNEPIRRKVLRKSAVVALFLSAALSGAQNLPLNSELSHSQASQERQSTNPAAKIGVKAYSSPISDAQVYFVASLPEAGTATIRVQEGAMGKIIAVTRNAGYAIIPTIRKGGNTVDFTVMSLHVDEKGNETIKHLGKVNGDAGQVISLDAAQGLKITLKKIEQPVAVISTSAANVSLAD